MGLKLLSEFWTIRENRLKNKNSYLFFRESLRKCKILTSHIFRIEKLAHLGSCDQNRNKCEEKKQITKHSKIKKPQ
jgi:hypothetical protein